MASRLALIIGNSVYRDSRLTRLTSPDADVGALAENLLDPDIGGFDDVRLLVNMTSATIRREISEFYSRKTSDDLLLLYFSGHGVLDESGQLFLAVKDTEHNLLRGTAISAHFITDEMDNTRSRRQVLILDCCHSGAFARGSKGVTGSSVGTGPVFEGTGYGRVVLTASDSTQYAWEGDKVIGDAEGSLFTHYLTEGLSTGEADANRDGNITVDELYDFVYDRIVRQTAKQTPGKWSYREQGEIVLAHAPTRSIGLQSSSELPIEEDLPQSLAQLYALGLSAHVMEEWDRALRFFQSVIDIQPDYRDTSTLLAETQMWLGLNDSYQKGLIALKESDYKEAVSALGKVVEINPDFRDARLLLIEAQQSLHLENLYRQAKNNVEAKRWKEAVECFDAIKAITEAYPDPENLDTLARSELDHEERMKEIEMRYQQALVAMKAKEWVNAEKEITWIQSIAPGYLETDALLSRVQGELSRLEERQRVQVQLQETYERARELIQKEQWKEAISRLRTIHEIDPEFPDPDRIALKAQAELDREEQEMSAKNELEALYVQAVNLLDEGNFAQALEFWRAIQSRSPEFPDSRSVRRKASWKLRVRAFSQTISSSRRLWVAIPIGVLLVILILFGFFILPQLQIRLGVTQAPAGSYILFVSNRDGRDEIYRMMSDGRTVRVTNTANGRWSNNPVPSKSGEILFTSNRDGKTEIYTLRLDGEIQRVTFTPGNGESLDPKPDPSGYLVFTSNRDGKDDIYRMDRIGNVSRITNSPGDSSSWAPVFDRNGNLLFTSNRNGKSEIYRLEPDGQTTRLTITPDKWESWNPIPDRSAYLIFVSNRDGSAEIYRMGWDGSITRVTDTPNAYDSYQPGLDEMGNLLFTSNRSGKEEIYRLIADGTIEQITNTLGGAVSCCPVSER